jgi:hypothetical protein
MAQFPYQLLNIRVRIAPGADLTAAPSTYTWTDITTYLHYAYDITAECGVTDDGSESNSKIEFVLRNNDRRWTIDNPESPNWPGWDIGCPVELALDVGDGAGYVVDGVGYVDSSKLEWPSNTPHSCIARVTASGPFGRLGRDPDLASALRRTIPSSKVRKAFWPLEDAAGALSAASAVPAVPPMAGVNPEYGTASLVPGASSVATFKPGAQLFANLPTPTTSQGFRLTCLLHAATIPAATAELFELRAAAGTVGRYVVQIGAGTLQVRAYNTAGTEISGAGAIGFTSHETDLVWFEVEFVQSAAGTITWTMKETTWRYTVDGLPSGSSGTGSSTFSGTLGGVTGVGIAPTGLLDDIQVGMLALCEQPFPASGGFAAVLGWAGNTATDRIQGMANEFRVPSSVTATGLGSVMGPQIVGSLLANLRNVQATDHGILTDHLGVVGYTALKELYNRAPLLTLAATTRGELAGLEPEINDQQLANVASANRPAGSSATVVDEDDVRKRGRYERSPITVNVARDVDLPGHAGWALARGRASGYDFKTLVVKPHLAPQTLPVALTLKLGDRITIDPLPQQMAKGGAERIIIGRKIVIPGMRSRTVLEISFNLTPVDAYNAFILDTDRLDTAGTELIVAASAADTGLVAQTARPSVTVTGATSIPLWAAGEKITLTAVADEALADTFGGAPVANGWGSMPATAHIAAQPWTSTVSAGTGTLADFARTGASATMTLQAAGSILRTHLAGLPMVHPELTTSMQISVTPTGAGIFSALQYRRGSGGGTDAYEVHIQVNPTGNPVLTLYSPTATVLAQLVLPFAGGPGVVYNVRAAPVESRHRVTVWQSGTTEPAYWMIDTMDDTRVSSGAVGLRSGRLAGNTNAGTTVTTYYNLSVFGVQFLTATRGAGGFSKALPYGSQVRLWKSRGLGV